MSEVIYLDYFLLQNVIILIFLFWILNSKLPFHELLENNLWNLTKVLWNVFCKCSVIYRFLNLQRRAFPIGTSFYRLIGWNSCFYFCCFQSLAGCGLNKPPSVPYFSELFCWFLIFFTWCLGGGLVAGCVHLL